jgi:hypothetical protein
VEKRQRKRSFVPNCVNFLLRYCLLAAGYGRFVGSDGC